MWTKRKFGSILGGEKTVIGTWKFHQMIYDMVRSVLGSERLALLPRSRFSRFPVLLPSIEPLRNTFSRFSRLWRICSFWRSLGFGCTFLGNRLFPWRTTAHRQWTCPLKISMHPHYRHNIELGSAVRIPCHQFRWIRWLATLYSIKI